MRGGSSGSKDLLVSKTIFPRLASKAAHFVLYNCEVPPTPADVIAIIMNPTS